MSDNIRVGLIGYGCCEQKPSMRPLIAGTPGLEIGGYLQQ